MATIKLTQGRSALIDDEDLPLVSRYTWHVVNANHTGKFYACTTLALNRRKKIGMHNLILGRAWVDHKDGNGLNNRRSNLRPCTPAQNQANRTIHSNNKSGFKGVYSTTSGKFLAQCGGKGPRTIGTFDTAKEAALAYNAVALERFGEFARLNTI
jgi:hypothetical protein